MSGNNDTYVGALDVLAKQISTMMGLADANLPFCVDLLKQVTDERRSPELAMQKAGVLPSSQGNPQGNAALGLPPGVMPGPGGASAPPASFMGAGIPGAGPQQSPPPANPDELRRILTAS